MDYHMATATGSFKKTKIGEILFEIFFENKEEIIKIIKENKTSYKVKKIIKDSFCKTDTIKRYKDYNEVVNESVIISLHSPNKLDTTFLFDHSMKQMKNDAIDIVFKKFLEEGITKEKLKEMINDLSNDEFNKKIFIDYIEKQL